MSKSFMEELEKTLVNDASNISVTENGAIGYKTTGKKLLDLNFAVSSLRSQDDSAIVRKIAGACAEDVNATIVWLFFARDVRGGLGERRLFRVAMHYLSREFPDKVIKILPLIAEYGRWDDLIDLAETKVSSHVFDIVRDQLTKDIKDMKAGKSVSLLGKWMPSENASSEKTKEAGTLMRCALKLSPKSYRVMLSALRKHIDIIERKMSMNEWDGISYEAVPSRANLIYNSAFLRHDEERRREYLGKLEKGETKINSSVLFPHDIVHKYAFMRNPDAAIEGMWKSLPDTVQDGEGTIVVADGSGSMDMCIGNSGVRAIEVANALAIYFAERLNPPYRDHYITFSETPQLVNMGGATSLRGKLDIARHYREVANTNIEAVFYLILQTAVNNHLEQFQLPKNILIISDMEFDDCACSDDRYTHGRYGYRRGVNKTLFQTIAEQYAEAGYHIPRMVFWNVNSRTGTIPVVENEYGVALVSGFSPNVAKMVMSGNLDPVDAMMETLTSERYAPVWNALSSHIENCEPCIH